MKVFNLKNLSIVVLKMVKFTIISIILVDFAPITFIFNLFQIFLGSLEKNQIANAIHQPYNSF